MTAAQPNFEFNQIAPGLAFECAGERKWRTKRTVCALKNIFNRSIWQSRGPGPSFGWAPFAAGIGTRFGSLLHKTRFNSPTKRIAIDDWATCFSLHFRFHGFFTSKRPGVHVSAHRSPQHNRERFCQYEASFWFPNSEAGRECVVLLGFGCSTHIWIAFGVHTTGWLLSVDCMVLSVGFVVCRMSFFGVIEYNRAFSREWDAYVWKRSSCDMAMANVRCACRGETTKIFFRIRLTSIRIIQTGAIVRFAQCNTMLARFLLTKLRLFFS